MNIVGESQILTLMDECRANQVPCVSGVTRDLLIDYITTYQPKYYVEIGCARGVSLYTAHQHMSTWGGSVVGVERSLPNVIRVQQTIQDHQLADIAIHHLNADTQGRDTVITQRIDMAFIDARKANYHLYLQTILPHMAENGVIICDDVIQFAHKLTSLYQFLDQNQMNYETIKLDDGDGVCIIKIGGVR